MKRNRLLAEMSTNEPHGGGADGMHALKRARDRGQSWSNTCEHYGDGARGIRRAGAHDANTCRSPHGTKRRASDADDGELERICDIATKRLRTLELDQSQVQRAYEECAVECEQGDKLPDLDYGAMNEALKVAHLTYLQERQRRGLPQLQPQDNSEMDEERPGPAVRAWPGLARQ